MPHINAPSGSHRGSLVIAPATSTTASVGPDTASAQGAHAQTVFAGVANVPRETVEAEPGGRLRHIGRTIQAALVRVRNVFTECCPSRASGSDDAAAVADDHAAVADDHAALAAWLARPLPPIPVVPAPPTFADTVARWYTLDEQTAAAARWRTVEPNLEFQKFLIKLDQSINARMEPDFRTEIAAWLDVLFQDKPQRDIAYSMAVDASENCEDRATLTYLGMRRAQGAHDIESGRYDHDAETLIALARTNMREEALDRIAQKKIRQLFEAKRATIAQALGCAIEAVDDDEVVIDEIEVALAYKVGVHDTLDPTGAVRSGRYTNTTISGVSDEELEQATEAVRRLDLRQYLTRWQPTLGVLARQLPAAFEGATQKRIDIGSDPDLFTARVNAHFEKEGLGRKDDASAETDSEALIQAGPVVLEQLNHEVYWPVMEAFLKQRGVSPATFEFVGLTTHL